MTKFSEVEGGRLDPEYALKIEYLNSIESKYPFVLLKNILEKQPQYGANEEAITGNPLTDIRYIRITDIDELGNLKPDTYKTAALIENQYILHINDLLFARSGATAGKCYIHKVDMPSIFAGYLIRFILKQNLANPDYVFYFCNSKLYSFWVMMIQRPSAQPNINSEEFKSLRIPLPPIHKQNEIAERITLIRNHAQALNIEADKILDNAKKNIEKMILGE